MSLLSNALVGGAGFNEFTSGDEQLTFTMTPSNEYTLFKTYMDGNIVPVDTLIAQADVEEAATTGEPVTRTVSSSGAINISGITAGPSTGDVEITHQDGAIKIIARTGGAANVNTTSQNAPKGSGTITGDMVLGGTLTSKVTIGQVEEHSLHQKMGFNSPDVTIHHDEEKDHMVVSDGDKECSMDFLVIGDASGSPEREEGGRPPLVITDPRFNPVVAAAIMETYAKYGNVAFNIEESMAK